MRIVAGLVSAGVVAALAVVSGCGAGAPEERAPGTTVTVEEPAGTPEAPATTEEPAAEAPTGAPAEPPAGQWPMPNLVGATLQDAQDQIQALTSGAVFFTGSHDLGGQDRNQVLDSNWKVCTQNVAPGAPLTADARVDFGVVKLDEACP